MKIYVVDDSMMTWAWVADIISHLEGLEIIGFTGNAKEAIDMFNELRPDIVFLNHELYGGSGIDVLKKIKEINPETTVAMLSNNTTPEFKHLCLGLGADYFFDKTKDYRKISQALLQMALSNKLFIEWYHMALNN